MSIISKQLSIINSIKNAIDEGLVVGVLKEDVYSNWYERTGTPAVIVDIIFPDAIMIHNTAAGKPVEVGYKFKIDVVDLVEDHDNVVSDARDFVIKILESIIGLSSIKYMSNSIGISDTVIDDKTAAVSYIIIQTNTT